MLPVHIYYKFVQVSLLSLYVTILLVSCAPKTSEQCLKKVQWTFSAQKKEALYREAIALDSLNLQARYALALAYHHPYDSVSIAISRKYLHEIIDIDSMQHVAWFWLCQSYKHINYYDSISQTKYVKQSDLDIALAYINKAISIYPYNGSYFYDRAYLTNNSNYNSSQYWSDLKRSYELGNWVAGFLIRNKALNDMHAPMFNRVYDHQ